MACSSMNDFFRDRGVFITGATGFVGKVLVEKLLRTCPDVRVIYVIVREKKGKNVMQILNGLLEAKLFDKIRAENKELLKKIVGLHGDISQPSLGLSSSDIELMCEDVSVVFNAAASIKLTEPIKNAIQTNLLSVRSLLEICHKMKSVAAIIHVSSISIQCLSRCIDELIYKSNPGPSKIIDIFDGLDSDTARKIFESLNEFPNSYIYTKRLAEDLFVDEGGNLPRAIVRPACVTCSWSDPFPSWIDNYSAWGTMGIAIGTGLANNLYMNPKMQTGMIPVDYCASAFIAAARETALNFTGEIKVYNCLDDSPKQPDVAQFVKLWSKFSSKYPLNDIMRIPRVFCRSYYLHLVFGWWDYYTYILPMNFLVKLFGKKIDLRKAFCQINRNMRAISYAQTKQWSFKIDNLTQLYNSLTPEEKKVIIMIYNFDKTQINYEKHIEDYVYGVKFYHLKETLESLPAARKRYKILLWTTRLWDISKYTLLWFLAFHLSGQPLKNMIEPNYLIPFGTLIVGLKWFGYIV